MTVTTDAKALFSEHDLGRDDALLAAKALGQQIVDESHATETPLSGIVYEVWGLYNDGMPACRFEKGDEGDAVVFEGTFRTQEGEAFVERRRTLSPEALKSLLDGLAGEQGK